MEELKLSKKPYSKKQITKHLEKLNNRWNNNYWIYVADSELHLMKCKRNGEHVMLNDGGVDPKYIVDSYLTGKCDGGDW